MGRGGRLSGRGMCGTSPHARQATGGEREPRGGTFDGREGPSYARGGAWPGRQPLTKSLKISKNLVCVTSF